MPFQEIDDSLIREMLGAVKSHMLQEMGQSILVVLLQQGTYVLNNIKGGSFFGLLVGFDVIGHPIAQYTRTNTFIVRHGRHGIHLCQGTYVKYSQHKRRQHQFKSFHISYIFNNTFYQPLLGDSSYVEKCIPCNAM